MDTTVQDQQDREKIAQFEAAVLSYWTAKLDTWEIARRLGVPECQVANALPRVLERRRAKRLRTVQKAERRVGPLPATGRARDLLAEAVANTPGSRRAS